MENKLQKFKYVRDHQLISKLNKEISPSEILYKMMNLPTILYGLDN